MLRRFAPGIISARLCAFALFVRDGGRIDAEFFAHEIAVGYGSAVLYRRAFVLRLVLIAIWRDRRSDGSEACHVKHHVTSRLARRSVVLLIFAKANRRETI